MDVLKYKEYEGTAELDMDRKICRGKILFINDLVTYQAKDPSRLQKEFEAAVDDYLETCAALKREPQKPLKGQFNVRIPPEMHKHAVLRAIKDHVKLNDIAVRSMAAYLYATTDVNHNVQVTLVGGPREFISVPSTETWDIMDTSGRAIYANQKH